MTEEKIKAVDWLTGEESEYRDQKGEKEGCPQCGSVSEYRREGCCATCLACGYSKCG